MGAWGSGPFENDGAGDLIASIGHGDFTFESVAWAFEGDYLEVDGGQIAIALLELVLIVRADRKRDPATQDLDLDSFTAAPVSARTRRARSGSWRKASRHQAPLEDRKSVV